MPIRIPTPRHPASKPATPRRGLRRWVYHTALLTAFAAGGGALLIWPQWVAFDGARSALELHQEREREFSDRLEVARATAGRLRLWEKEGRRVFVADELDRYGVLTQAVAKREGATVVKTEVTEGRPARWRSVTLDRTGVDAGADSAGEIRPQVVRLVLKGSFDGVFRTVTALTQQQQLFVPDRWTLARGGKGASGAELWAEIWGTVFTVRQPQDDVPEVPREGSGASRVAWEGTR